MTRICRARLALAAIVFLLPASVYLQGQTLEADYQVQGTLNDSSGSGIGPLVGTGDNNISFQSDTVNGHVQKVLRIATNTSATLPIPQSGVQAQTNPFVDGSNYSIVLLASFDLSTTGVLATKIFDFKNLSSDAGLYVNDATGNLEFVNGSSVIVANGVPGTNLTTNSYIQIALTRDSATNLVSVYETDLSGTTTLAFSFTDSTGLAILGDATNTGNQFLTLFQDDGGGIGGSVVDEGTQGNIARLRLYNGVLSASDIAALDTTVPEPTTWALLGVGAVALGVVIRRRG